MSNRRNFLKNISVLGLGATIVSPLSVLANDTKTENNDIVLAMPTGESMTD